MNSGRGHCAWWQFCKVPNQTHRKIEKMYAIKQIKICAEYRDMLPRPRLDLSGTPGLRPIGLSPGSWQTSLGLGSMSRYSAQILICITQEETQQLESPHRLAHIYCQIPSLSPGLSYDQQCYQWFTGKLNCFMDTYPSNSVDQSSEATHSAAKKSLSDRFMFNPDCIFCHSDRCKKVKKAHYWTKELLSKFECGDGEYVIKTAEAKNKIMIFFYWSRDRTFVFVKPSSTQVVWKGTQQSQNYGTVWMYDVWNTFLEKSLRSFKLRVMVMLILLVVSV